jgi:pilus assembly protein Flp/PilA
MHTWIDITKALIRGDSGVTAIEYALLGALIAVAVVGSVIALGNSVSDLYQRIADAVVSALS